MRHVTRCMTHPPTNTNVSHVSFIRVILLIHTRNMTLTRHGQQDDSDGIRAKRIFEILENIKKKPGHEARGSPSISVAAVFLGMQTYK